MLGLTVLPEYFQSEGVNGLLDHLQSHAPFTSIATSPYVMAESDRERGQREPPADAGSGAKRLLDRPLWGKREVWVETAPSFKPNPAHYQSTRYQPAPASELTEREGHMVSDFIAEAKTRGIEVLLQVQAAIPPGYRVQFGGPDDKDRPMLPDGSFPKRRLALNGSLASEDILNYGEGLIRDLMEQHPEASGIRIDWPEYPPYFLDDLFLDFNPQVQPVVEGMNIDFEELKSTVSDTRSAILNAAKLSDLEQLLTRLSERLRKLIQLKGTLVQNMMNRYRAAIGVSKKLIPGIFPHPWNEIAGSDETNFTNHSDAIFCKLYTMHWPMIVDHYRSQILEANPTHNADELTRVIVEWLGIDSADSYPSSRYTYPDPDTPHPVGSESQRAKIAEAQVRAGESSIVPIAHSYGPVDDFRNRLKVAWEASNHGVLINRYGYVSDEKLKAIAEVCS